ncbi:hypothetical protein BGZ58_009984, partial [Dissophora ornata]
MAMLAITKSAWAAVGESITGEASMRILDPTSNDMMLPPGAMTLANPFLTAPPRAEEDCPPCFNCELNAFPCTHFAPCNGYDGRCTCPPGFAGDNCAEPVCEADHVCDELVPTGRNGTCYKGGYTVYESFQQCDVT